MPTDDSVDRQRRKSNRLTLFKPDGGIKFVRTVPLVSANISPTSRDARSVQLNGQVEITGKVNPSQVGFFLN